MENSETLKRRISVAFGRELPDKVFTNCSVVNVFTNELEKKDILVCDGKIAGIGSYADSLRSCGLPEGRIVDLAGKTVCPGLIDGHIHIESSMMPPSLFAEAVIPHGTTAVITDPHEIVNVAGIGGFNFMLENSKDVPMDIFFVVPSCVPATELDEAGAALNSDDIEVLMKSDRVVGLAEMMNAFGTVRNDDEIIRKIQAAERAGKVVDGHAPGLTGTELNAYVTSGVASDHECSTAEEALEKLRLGQWIMIREGTAAKNLERLMPLFDEKYYGRCMLVTDDKHPGDLIRLGHIDYIVREAIRRGADPYRAIRMASFNAAEYFGLKAKGAVAPGYKADFIVIDSIYEFNVLQVYYNGEIVAKDGKICNNYLESKKNADLMIYPRVFNSFNMPEIKAEDLKLEVTGSKRRVIGLVPNEILTTEIITDSDLSADLQNGIVKVALIERHKNTGHIGLGFMSGYGLKKGAIASSIGHDSHNLIVAGTNEEDMALAANTVRSNTGGLAVVAAGCVLGELPLPIAGLMGVLEKEELEEKLNSLKEKTRELGVDEGTDPFMTLSFASLPVIPSLRITTHGLVDVATQSVVPVFFD